LKANQHQFAAIPSPLSEEDDYNIHPDKIAEEIARGTSVILTSNPRNPTGHVVTNPELAEIQDICRDRATLVMDEFYGGYNYTSDCDGTSISAADNIDDVDEDDVLIIDGLTKRFRLPGWRIAWIVGPKVHCLPIFPICADLTIYRNSSRPSDPAGPTLMEVPTSPSKKPPSPCLSPKRSSQK
jgi:aspartate/methionine/tyrosine aminotransferase